ncbi:hypothetical protein BCR41DRAFT_365418 [Lobosporangium transversale]|uniref:Uncharacterized protein n=1 Tax=Lobosporangium transversale TaxID=64571 RepID=A0A1Y2G7M8_9FUNG|nr:hypothetical protein BCR41DRAFT_365418 [Lobosporangium transversale]ORY94293.1 hypothetical protein BCR41DRAFT_365418 [Lobosporangium transversale]|eukprot:XP_021875236.1 hypothetical protein BCR41DRAFT_365418 [Lobosporangium transversale]
MVATALASSSVLEGDTTFLTSSSINNTSTTSTITVIATSIANENEPENPSSVESSENSFSTFVSSCPLIHSQPPVHAIEADQLFSLHQKFVSTPLPSKSMFPWLHGVDGTDSTQNYFFGIEQSYHHHLYYTGSLTGTGADAMMVDGETFATNHKLPIPEHRGLMFVHTCERDLGRLVGSISPSEILKPAPRVLSATRPSDLGSQNASANKAQQSSPPQLGDINNHPQMHHQYTDSPSVQQQLQQQQQQDANQGVTGHESDWDDSSLSSSSFSSTTSSSTNAVYPPSASTSKSAKSSSFSTVGMHPMYSGSFLQSQSEGINIRNFKIQVPRYALLSDIVVYANEGEQDLGILQLAKQISAAQDEIWQLMKEQYPQMTFESRRQTFVLKDSFAIFETKYPELIAVASNGQPSRNKVDFWEQEREQMALLTRASEIAPGIWLGNNTDVPLTNTGASSLATPVSPGTSFSSYFFPPSSIPHALSQSSSASSATVKPSTLPSTPPPEENEYPPLTPPSFNNYSNFHPSICVECRSGANAPTTMTLDRIRSNVACTPAPLSTKEIFHLECLGALTAGVNPDAFPPSTSSLSSFARPDHIDISATHAMRRATASGLLKNLPMMGSMLQTQVNHLVNMAFFIHAVTAPDAKKLSSFSNNNQGFERVTQQQPLQPIAHQVLIHCVDGYTESALLALAVVMIHYQISLAEAYVKLQTDLGRSFFVYPNDAVMMLEVENQIWQRILMEKVDREASTRLSSTIGSNQQQEAASGASSLSSSASSSSSSSSSFSSSLNMSNTTASGNTPSSSSSLPSPISPSASTPSLNMMMEGIESAQGKKEEPIIQKPYLRPGHEERFQWFYHPEFEGSFPSRILPFLYLGNLAHASNPGLLKSLGIRYVLSVGEEAHGLDEDVDVGVDANGNSNGDKPPASSSKFMVKLVDDMFDNGVDSLWRHLENCVSFVDEARRANARILIHCRVGVSRSATIVIAYLMAHYNLSLVDAYLMVRARRLSVIIQPNLLFMYELLQWEQRLKGRFDPMGWPGIAREVHNLNMYYIGN